MSTFGSDPMHNVIYNGIVRDVKHNLESGLFRATIILVYAGIDSMAFFSMPHTQNEVTKTDFINWCDRYLRFDCAEKIGGIEFYSARCGVLHSYGSSSRITNNGHARQIGYTDNSLPPIQFEKTISKELVLVSIRHLVESFIKGVNQCLIDVFRDEANRPKSEARLNLMIHAFDVKQ